MRFVVTSLPDQVFLSNHSFRRGYIDKLWQYSNDIEYVRQTISHHGLDTTSVDVRELSD